MILANRQRRARARTRRQGAALLEFALVSLALYLLLAGVIGLGRWMSLVQSAQDAARVIAREASLYPLPANYDFDQALADAGFRSAVYSPDFLVVDLATTPPGADLDAAFAAMPVGNRALRPLMVVSDVLVGTDTRRLLHVPGAITDSPTAPSGLTVVVPRVVSRAAGTGAETIEILPVVEEVGPGSFSLASPDRGLVILRINVPYQSATLSAYLPAAALPGGTPGNQPIVADDSLVQAPDGVYYPIAGPGPTGSGPYSGTYGLGEHLSLGQGVRPFRRLVSAQAIFRREVVL